MRGKLGAMPGFGKTGNDPNKSPDPKNPGFEFLWKRSLIKQPS
jgi:hypothetical protein